MKARNVFAWIVFFGLGTANGAEPLPLSAFARIPAVDQVTLSPDGRYLAMIRPDEGMRMAYVVDLKENAPLRRVMGGIRTGNFVMTWCRWANATRLLCAYRSMKVDGEKIYPTTRLATVNADGSDLKFLVQNIDSVTFSQLHDRVIDLSPAEQNNILLQLDANRDGVPKVYKLDIYTGQIDEGMREHEPIRHYITDGRGEVRAGIGILNAEVSTHARAADTKNWSQLAKFKAFNQGATLLPLAMNGDGDKAFARGDHEGRAALWELDLSNRTKPTLLFSHPTADVGEPIVVGDGRMIGVRYDTDRQFAFHTDPAMQLVVDSLKDVLPAGTFNVIADVSQDNQQFVIKSTSDVDGGSYYLLSKGGKLGRIGVAYPELSQQAGKLAHMRAIRYRAGDGTEIPGYLTVPAGQRAEKLPLIVLPHGGPIAHDTLEFNWLAQFLASRGYGVLQMNYRGSSGYGDKWFRAAHQDWGGVTYSDITDATRWAIKEGIADPKRICIVGSDFGGYAALLSAERNGDLYKCAVSIAGITDQTQLQEDVRDLSGRNPGTRSEYILQRDEAVFGNQQLIREQIGEDKDKLAANSPLRQVKAVAVPVLLIHGDMDAIVRVSHSREMAKALKREKKSHKLVEIKDADHQLSRESDRVTLLTELEAFVDSHLGASAGT